jgi:glyoxylase-like metal-dependent hydrolase (beta-lactamase superfamily II)
LASDLWSIPVPIPGPLRNVSVYVFAADDGLLLLDAGWDSSDAWDALTTGLTQLGATVADVRGVLVSHLHYDHIGLTGRVAQESGAWVALHGADLDLLSRPDYRDAQLATDAEAAYLRSLGADDDEAAAVVGTAQQRVGFTSMRLPGRRLEHDQVVRHGGWSLRAVHTPGHTPGHCVFVDEEHSRLFAGDHVLPRISPNISAERASPPDPLGDYLRSLGEVAELPLEHVLPAHEWRFDGLATRCDQLLAHHEKRLAELLDAVDAEPGGTAWSLAGRLTWSRPWEQYGGRLRVFAVTETAAHLQHLVTRGDVETVTVGQAVGYRAASGKP